MTQAATARTAALWLAGGPALAVAACSPAPNNRAAQVDIANAARTPLVRPDPIPSPSPATSRPTPRPSTVTETPFTRDSAQGAADVVQTYFALIEAGKHDRAWALWGDGGKASGMSLADFTASFAKYRDYHAKVGAPGPIDAGAGQRYVTIPVRTYGHLATGGEFAMEGPVTLHRVADIDGASAEQRGWRISASELRPQPR